MEENRKGNTLYAVLGVATLVVAIIGATFAYFSAQATATGDEIKGGTTNIALTLNVDRVLFGAGADETGAYMNLVPAQLDLSGDTAKANVANAVNSKCISGDYTGCHLYKITAKSASALTTASISLNNFDVTATDKDAWKFIVFTGLEATAEGTTTYTVSDILTGTTPEDFSTSTAKTGSAGYNLLGLSEGFTANEEKVFYLLVYLGNIEQIQNPTSTENEYSGIGDYSGSVSFKAAEANVVANFNTTTSIGEE